jgi:hypothetical protein
LVAVSVEERVGVAEAVWVGRGVRLGRNVKVGDGVKLSIAGWKGVGVALAFGSTVTRLRGGEEAAEFPAGSVQDARNIKPKKTLSARRVRLVMLVGITALGGVPAAAGSSPAGYGGLSTLQQV